MVKQKSQLCAQTFHTFVYGTAQNGLFQELVDDPDHVVDIVVEGEPGFPALSGADR
jgi:hypothetical protein